MADGKYFATTKKGGWAWSLPEQRPAIQGSARSAVDHPSFYWTLASVHAAGEIHELREELASLDRPKKKEAVKKVIAAMTVGKDVSMLFPHVVNCMQTEDLELKKLVYLYLINYAKTQPDLAIMAVNTFVKVGGTPLVGDHQGWYAALTAQSAHTAHVCAMLQDSQDPNPLIRALAVRTMGCIRVDKITEYLCDPLQRCLKVTPQQAAGWRACLKLVCSFSI